MMSLVLFFLLAIKEDNLGNFFSTPPCWLYNIFHHAAVAATVRWNVQNHMHACKQLPDIAMLIKKMI